MFRIKFSTVILSSVVTIFALISKIVFDKVYLTSHIVVDEEFHLQLGHAYCKYEFDKWHPKVTTFPGLYLLSSLLFGAFDVCSTYFLRLTSLIFSFINVILFYYLLNANNESPPWHNIISSLNLALLPPLYFFSHVYYTDVPSLTMILVLFLLSQRGNHYFASVFGICAVLFRQTNIIWVGMVFACYLLQEITTIRQKKTRSSKGVSTKEFVDLLRNVKHDVWYIIQQTTPRFWLNTSCYASVLISFVVFVYFNGSIVVGDKSAHEATIHVPQLFYFSLFCFFFGWPLFLPEVFNFFKFVTKYKVFCLSVLVLSPVIVHFNTLVHPYMLADNRHYIFYIWNRFYGKYPLFRYLVVPLYLFAWFVIIKKLFNRRDVTFLLFFIPCTSAVLITQKLLELRYFFISFVLFRIKVKNVSVHSLACEFVTHCVLNACTLYLFFTKTIEWQDYDYPQRLIW